MIDMEETTGTRRMKYTITLVLRYVITLLSRFIAKDECLLRRFARDNKPATVVTELSQIQDFDIYFDCGFMFDPFPTLHRSVSS